jgi:hypothetical protein
MKTLSSLVDNIFDTMEDTGLDTISTSILKDLVMLYNTNVVKYSTLKTTNIEFDLTRNIPITKELVPLYISWIITSYYTLESGKRVMDKTTVPIIEYIAASYKHYTLSMVLAHVEEIYSIPNVYGLIRYVLDQTVRDYLTIMKKYNTNLPEDLRLWLELNY